MKFPKDIKIWRASFETKKGQLPDFRGEWFLGDGWQRESWGRNPHAIIECRELPHTRLYSYKIVGSEVQIKSLDFRNTKSRKSSKYYHAANGLPYGGEVTYLTETILDAD